MTLYFISAILLDIFFPSLVIIFYILTKRELSLSSFTF